VSGWAWFACRSHFVKKVSQIGKVIMMNVLTQYARQYTTFEDERTRPVRDLVDAIPNVGVRTAIDLGCGPGNSTEVLAARYPTAYICGIDSSEDMIHAAQKRLPKLTFDVGLIETWDCAIALDVILANASLQWAPDHATLYPKLVRQLVQGGSLAIQTPDNYGEPAHQLLLEMSRQDAWRAKLGDVARYPRENAQWYYGLLREHCTRVNIWQTTYYHPLEGGARAIVEWFKGSALRPYLERLDANEQAAFLDAYTVAIAKAYPEYDDGFVLLPFPRLFIVATR
jgi:trans-aconitate 2-methyltransferase